METPEVVAKRDEPVLRQPVPKRPANVDRPIGAVRLPIAGPYRPWARLYRRTDGRLVWAVRLWEVDRAERRWVDTEVLRTFAQRNRLPALLAEIDARVERARRTAGP